MSLLTMMQQVTRRIGLTVPNAVMSSTDPQVIQLVGLANEEGQELSERYPWQAMQKEATFTTVAATTQVANIYTTWPDFKFILNETIWDRTLRRPVFGPIDPQIWQQLSAQVLQGPFYQYRIRGNSIVFIPTPAAGDNCYFEYVSTSWCASAGGTGQNVWTADTDVGVMDESIMTQGIIWRWKQVKGFEYAQDFNKYEQRISDAMGRDSGKSTLDMGGASGFLQPAVLVPSGNWNV